MSISGKMDKLNGGIHIIKYSMAVEVSLYWLQYYLKNNIKWKNKSQKNKYIQMNAFL